MRKREYSDKYEEFISQGMERLDADLLAHVHVSWMYCQCETCGHLDKCPTVMEHFVPVGMLHRALYYLDQYVLCSNCETVEEVRRYDERRTDSKRRGSVFRMNK